MIGVRRFAAVAAMLLAGAAAPLPQALAPSIGATTTTTTTTVQPLAPSALDAAAEELAAAYDASIRMTVDVMVNGQGPFKFAVDTGADRTAISAGLARRLKLPADGTAMLHGMAGVDMVPMVTIGKLQVGKRTVADIRSPALPDSGLGVAGLLGIDALEDQKVVMDFERETMSVKAGAPRAPEDADTIVVTAKRRFGQLILVDASVDGQKVFCIVDSGASNTIGNPVLRKMLANRRAAKDAKPIELVSVTGRMIGADLTTLPKIRLGNINLQNVPIAYSDAHPFKKFGLTRQPALLLGVDVLQSFRRVSLDFETKKVRFLLKNGAALDAGRQLASMAPRRSAATARP